MQLSTKGGWNMVESLPMSCERVAMRWTATDIVGQTAGLGARTNIRSLTLEDFRCRQHLSTDACHAPCSLALPCQGVKCGRDQGSAPSAEL